jgi:hypothetical protein
MFHRGYYIYHDYTQTKYLHLMQIDQVFVPHYYHFCSSFVFPEHDDLLEIYFVHDDEVLCACNVF